MVDDERKNRKLEPEDLNKVVTNPVIEVIKNRQSVRAYMPKPVPRGIINAIIEAGNLAPSQGREEKGSVEALFQPWRFVVVEDPEFIQKLVRATLPIWNGMYEEIKETHPDYYEKVTRLRGVMDEPKDMVYYSAPVILFVIGPAEHALSCALACENIMLAACSLGLGSCYVGFGSMVTGDAGVVQALELKDSERVYGPIVLGYPKDVPEARAMRPKKNEPIIKWI
ncbi:MAG: nitroreductase family protein [Candidatus Bathyarchaeia archaeon]